MVVLVSRLSSGYTKLLEWGDPRVEDYMFMGSPLAVLIVLGIYLLFVFKLGPSLMKNRQPYKLTNTIMVYNIVQIIFNSCAIPLAIIVYPHTSIFCTPHDKYDMTMQHWLYFLLKAYDLIDTIFFVLRKKYSQITVLHLYHHILMLLGSWITCKYFPGGQLFFVGAINCVVHIAVYFYYFLTAWNPKFKKSIWWKRHLTELQIAQHCLIFLTFLVPLLNPSCSYPKYLSLAALPPTALMIYLFADFYVKAYVSKKDS